MIIDIIDTTREGYTGPEYSVFCGCVKIGAINYRPDRWDKDKPYSTQYRESGEDSRFAYDGRYPNIYTAKMGVYNAWKSAGEHRPVDEHKTAHVAPQRLLAGADNDFWPTPSKISGQMLALVDWKNVKNVLEPSAGKGDLVECAQKGNFRGFGRYDRELDVDCIEADRNLQHILTGKGYRVIHDDFLSFHTNKHYDLIIMNPPFSDGDKHLMKAIDLQRNGGQIVCLLNAETLRNPCTNLRRLLMQKLDQYGAAIRYVSGGFTRAERKSDVTVAIISIKFPASSKLKSEFFERLKKAGEQKTAEWEHEPTAIATGSVVEQLVKSFDVETAASLALFREYNAMTPYIQNECKEYSKPLFSLKIGERDYNYINGEAVNSYLQNARRKYWWTLFSLPELTAQFTSNIMQTYRDSIDKMADYDFTIFNVKNVLIELNGSLRDGVHDAIMGLFDKLTIEHSWYPECANNRHYYNGWAHNKAHMVNKKVVIPMNGYSSSSWKPNELDQYRVMSELSDLEKSLNYLDFGETTEFDLGSAIHCAVLRGQTRNIDCKYFSVTFYKKGTCHITFHSQKILDVLNIYAAQGRNWLPPCYGKKSYEDMSQDEQAVIDDFQGKEAYEQVFQNQGKYLVPTEGNLLQLGA